MNSISDWYFSLSLNEIVSYTLGVLGIILAWYFYHKGKRQKKPQFSIRSFNLISDSIQSIEDIKVTYLGSPVNNLTISKIAIWNAGNDTLNNSDQAINDKLRIVANNGTQIFKANIMSQSNTTCNFIISMKINVVDVLFDFIDENQGCVIKIIHSGKESDDLNVNGTFKGFGKIIKKNTRNLNLLDLFEPFLFGRPTGKRRRILIKVIPWIILIVGLTIINYPFNKSNIPSFLIFWMYIILGSIYILFGSYLMNTGRNLPKEFDSFYGDD